MNETETEKKFDFTPHQSFHFVSRMFQNQSELDYATYDMELYVSLHRTDCSAKDLLIKEWPEKMLVCVVIFYAVKFKVVSH